MKHYRELSKNNAVDFLQDYIGQKDVGLEYLKNCLSENGFDLASFDYSPESLIPIWELLHTQIEFLSDFPDYEAHLNELPIWILLDWGMGRKDLGGYSIKTIKILDGLGYYLAEIFLKNHDGTHWDICPWSDPNTAGANQPIIRLKPKKIWLASFITPLSGVKGCAIYTRLYKENLSITNLYDAYKWAVDERINAEPPEPPVSEFKDNYPTLAEKLQYHGIYTLDELVEIQILSKDDRVTIDEIECNKVFHTTSGLEQIIGAELFNKLESTLMAIDGIKFAAQEDRGLFYLKSSVAKKKLQILILEAFESFFQ